MGYSVHRYESEDRVKHSAGLPDSTYYAGNGFGFQDISDPFNPEVEPYLDVAHSEGFSVVRVEDGPRTFIDGKGIEHTLIYIGPTT